MIPSAIFFSFEEDAIFFGHEAVAEYVQGIPGRLIRGLKGLLGSALVHERFRVRHRAMPYSRLVSLLIGYIKHRAEVVTGCMIENVVLGRPVHFVDDDRTADALAQEELYASAKDQGFRNIEFQFEPIAAALHYEQSVTREEVALIVDIGGGTSDFSVVRVSPARAKATHRKEDILANAGVHVGGGDFDRLLNLSKVMPHLGYGTRTLDHKRELPTWCYLDLATWQRINFLSEPKILRRLKEIRREAEHPGLVQRLVYIVEHRLGFALAAAVEEAKISLTHKSDTKLEFEVGSEEMFIPLSKNDLLDAIQPSIDKIIRKLHQTVVDSGLTPGQIDTIFFTGGSVLIPDLKRQLLQNFSDAKVVEGDLFGSVARGLALEAQKRFK